jgi:hypothetical protein
MGQNGQREVSALNNMVEDVFYSIQAHRDEFRRSSRLMIHVSASSVEFQEWSKRTDLIKGFQTVHRNGLVLENHYPDRVGSRIFRCQLLISAVVKGIQIVGAEDETSRKPAILLRDAVWKSAPSQELGRQQSFP